MHIDRVGAPMREQAVRNLRAAIVSGRLKPGERLRERAICQLLGASRTVVREALRHLESEGLVETIAGHGPAVSVLTAQTAREVFEARAVLEAMAAELCASRSNAEGLDHLRRAYDGLSEAYDAGDVQSVLAAKDRFYDTLFSVAGNEVLAGFVRTLRARITQLRATSLSRAGRLDRSREEIRALVAAIERRDAAAARTLAERHVREAESVALAVLRESSEQHASGNKAEPTEGVEHAHG